MEHTQFMATHEITQRFVRALAEMYREEVPKYGDLVDLVETVNAEHLRQDDNLQRLSSERHGAIRLGKPSELRHMRQLFEVMGMYPVNYYDLTVAGLPLHATCFRPISDEHLRIQPFRVFTSLLQLDLIQDEALKQEVENILNQRNIFSQTLLNLITKIQHKGGLIENDCDSFIHEAVNVFRWHKNATVDIAFYKKILATHRLIADIVCFQGPHINHLTPRTLDIDDVQQRMPEYAISPKAVIEGPPKRKIPILLRQTSFKALEEPIFCIEKNGDKIPFTHTARFGEIEERGAALTPKGKELYDRLMQKVRSQITPLADGSNASHYMKLLEETFKEFPDDLHTLWQEQLIYVSYNPQNKEALTNDHSLNTLVNRRVLKITPLIYEDFLPISAAGIFQSNLGDEEGEKVTAYPRQEQFEKNLKASVISAFDIYQAIEAHSLKTCFLALGIDMPHEISERVEAALKKDPRI